MLKKPGKSRLRRPPWKLEMTDQQDEAIKAQLPVCALAPGVTGQVDPNLPSNIAPAHL